jgi:hypothetical protein
MAKRLTEVTVRLPWVEGKWVADDRQRAAAWEIYVELVTRIAIEPLGKDAGLLREALSSLYSLFGETRRILRAHGPSIAIPERKKFLSLGQIAVDVLNVMLRPVTEKWHPMLMHHEATRPPNRSQVEHERAWDKAAELRGVLEKLRLDLVQYADILAAACEIPSLHARAPLE